VEDAGLEACIAPGGAAEGDLRVDGDGWAGAAAGTWSPGGGKRAMLLCALLRRGSAYAHAKRCAACGSGLRRAVSWLPQSTLRCLISKASVRRGAPSPTWYNGLS